MRSSTVDNPLAIGTIFTHETWSGYPSAPAAAFANEIQAKAEIIIVTIPKNFFIENRIKRINSDKLIVGNYWNNESNLFQTSQPDQSG